MISSVGAPLDDVHFQMQISEHDLLKGVLELGLE
jgi:hypothetical protein